LRERYDLGDDPYDPHNNVLAGTAYLREMYDRFGSPGFLAAYNAGPNRVDRYLNNGTPLPAETVNYVASIAPSLGSDRPMSGPLAVYANRFPSRSTPSSCDPDAAYDPSHPCAPTRPVLVAAAAPVYRPPAPTASAGCDPDAAYNPDGPCTPVQPAVVAAVAPAPAYATSGDCDPDAAFDPSRPCQPRPVSAVLEPVIAQPLQRPTPARQPEYAVVHRPIQEGMALPVAFAPGPPPGHWAIQVGAFATLSTAQNAAENARSELPALLRTTKVELPATSPFGNKVAFRARLSGLTQAAAVDACSHLTGRGTACITVSPTRDF
ncbi:MAG TPA: transglycosylase SLT domain-containing protein, partial [Rhodopila sp.]